MLDAFSLLRAMNGIHEEDVVMADKLFESKKPARARAKRIVTLALAAALILALSAGGYALFFSMSHRVPDPEETYRIHWEDSPSGYIEWKNVGLAVTFPETEESHAIEFRPGWLPEEMASLQGDWVSRLTAERLCFEGDPNFAPAYDDMTQPMLIESYSMSRFNQGGALLLIDTHQAVHLIGDTYGGDVASRRFRLLQHLLRDDAHVLPPVFRVLFSPSLLRCTDGCLVGRIGCLCRAQSRLCIDQTAFYRRTSDVVTE